jgi:hypothetical protein
MALFENQIEVVLKQDADTKNLFLGVFAFDELPKKPKFPSCFIINTQKRNQEGEHWLAIFLNKFGFAYFFDSYGYPPSYFNLEKYMTDISKGWVHNEKKIQTFSNICGYYCILFLLYICKGKESVFFKQFKNSSLENDKIILKIKKDF